MSLRDWTWLTQAITAGTRFVAELGWESRPQASQAGSPSLLIKHRFTALPSPCLSLLTSPLALPYLPTLSPGFKVVALVRGDPSMGIPYLRPRSFLKMFRSPIPSGTLEEGALKREVVMEVEISLFVNWG